MSSNNVLRPNFKDRRQPGTGREWESDARYETQRLVHKMVKESTTEHRADLVTLLTAIANADSPGNWASIALYAAKEKIDEDAGNGIA